MNTTTNTKIIQIIHLYYFHIVICFPYMCFIFVSSYVQSGPASPAQAWPGRVILFSYFVHMISKWFPYFGARSLRLAVQPSPPRPGPAWALKIHGPTKNYKILKVFKASGKKTLKSLSKTCILGSFATQNTSFT